jgi:galactose mutarotase-like enzyme
LEITIQNKHLKASIYSKGAELFSLKNSATNREYIWEGNPEFWGKHSPVLFPIVGTLKNNQYNYNNQPYSLPRHGFARDLEFELVESTTEMAIFSLQSSAETKRQYSFDFELQIKYLLDEKELIVAYKIFNKTNDTMPFSIGAHPAFSLLKSFSSYELEFEIQEELNSFTLEKDLLSDTIVIIPMTEKKLRLNYALFEKDALIFKQLQSKKIIILEEGRPILNFHFEDFKNFGIWTKNNAPFICLEPWLGYSDLITSNGNIQDKEGIQQIEAYKEFNCNFKIEIL